MENLKALERQQTKVSLKHITNEIYEIFFKEYIAVKQEIVDFGEFTEEIYITDDR